MENILVEYRKFLGMNYRKINTQIRYLNSAKKYLRFVGEISQGETQRYIIYLNQTQKPNAVTSNIVGLNRFLMYMGRKDLRVSTPSWKPILRDTIKRGDIVRIVSHAHENYPFMDYLILLMVRDLDCRNHEIIRTRWDWIHGDKILFQDCKTGDTTGRLSKDLREALEKWHTITPYPDQPYVFHIPYGACRGKPIGKTGLYIRHLINRISLEVIGRKLNPQDLRASVITAEYTAYVNPKIIQRKARHRSEKTTMRYNHVDDEMVAEYMDNGTIFNDDKEPVLKPNSEVALNKLDKRGCINTYPEVIPGTLIEEEEDNSRFSFSISFFVTILDLGDDGSRANSYLEGLNRSYGLQSFSVTGFFISHTRGGVVGAWSVIGSSVGDSESAGLPFPPFSSLSVTRFCDSQCSSSDRWLMGRWVTGFIPVVPFVTVPSSPYVVESSFPPKDWFCADERADGSFFCFHNLSSLMIFSPGSFQSTATMFCHGSTPGCGVLSSEREKDGWNYLWRSNPGQVRGTGINGGVLI